MGILPNESYLEQALGAASPGTDLPILPLKALIYLKLKSPRRRDEADVVELLRINDPAPVRQYLEKNAPGLLAKFDAIAAEAG
jgi:hypothetical protein